MNPMIVSPSFPVGSSAIRKQGTHSRVSDQLPVCSSSGQNSTGVLGRASFLARLQKACLELYGCVANCDLSCHGLDDLEAAEGMAGRKFPLKEAKENSYEYFS